MDWSDKVIDYGKIRLSYGKSGRQFDQPYIAYGVWASGDPYLGEPSVHPVFRDGLMNRELTWEETRQFDAGLDLDLFNYRLGIVLDYYHRYTDKLLYKVNLPGNYTGFEQQWRNAYGIVNQGIEFQIKTDLIRTERLKWNITFNIAKNWNMLKKSNDKRDFISAASYDNINVVGRPLNCIYVFRDHGFYTDDSQVSYYYIDGKKVPLRGAYGNQFYQTGDPQDDHDGADQKGQQRLRRDGGDCEAEDQHDHRDGDHGGQRLPQLFPKDGFASSQTFLPLFLSFPRQSHHLSKIHTIYIDIIIIS